MLYRTKLNEMQVRCRRSAKRRPSCNPVRSRAESLVDEFGIGGRTACRSWTTNRHHTVDRARWLVHSTWRKTTLDMTCRDSRTIVHSDRRHQWRTNRQPGQTR